MTPAAGAPPSVSEEVQGFYTRAARYDFASALARRTEEIKRRGATYQLIESLRHAVPSGRFRSALEVGGEYATTLAVLADRFQIDARTSCDLVLPPHQIPGIRYEVLAAEALARRFPADSFDLILMIDVIEHLFDPDAVMDAVRTVLAPGGLLAIITPNLASWLNRMLLLGGYMPLDPEVSTRRAFGRPDPVPSAPAGHIRVFTQRALLEFLQFHGFRVLTSESAPLGFSHPSYVAAPDQPSGPPPRSPSGRFGSALPWFLAADRVVARAAPALGSRLIVVASRTSRGAGADATGPG